MANENVKRIVVTVDDANVASIDAVAAALRSAGMQVSNVMSTGGIITGEVGDDKLHTLKSVPGVLDVEPDEEMRAI